MTRIETDPCFGGWALWWIPSTKDLPAQLLGRSENGVMELREGLNKHANALMYRATEAGLHGELEGMALQRMVKLEVVWDGEMKGLEWVSLIFRGSNMLHERVNEDGTRECFWKYGF